MTDKLVPCPDCGAQVSPRAAACPQCGAPVARKEARVHRAGARWEGIGFALIIAGMVAGFSGSPAWFAVGALLGVVGFVVFIIGRFK